MLQEKMYRVTVPLRYICTAAISHGAIQYKHAQKIAIQVSQLTV